MKYILFSLFFLTNMFFPFQSQQTKTNSLLSVGNGPLKILLETTGNGIKLNDIKNDNSSILANESALFTLTVSPVPNNNTTYEIRSDDTWSNMQIDNNGSVLRAVLSGHTNPNIPNSLHVTVTITASDKHSQWDLSVSGLGSNYSLVSARFPLLELKSTADDNLLLPKYSGKLIHDPVGSATDMTMTYPRGWSATMQFLAKYNDIQGIYLGFHDPKASLKHFNVRTMNGHLSFHGNVVIADKTIAGNDWDFPGHFELDLFDGDWYDAAQIYKAWASDMADYWPRTTPERSLRQQELGRIAIWAYYSSPVSTPITSTRTTMETFIDYFPGVPVGIHWYQWNYKDMDDDYPDYFPERDGMTGLVTHLQQKGKADIMPYINGRLYDTDLTGEWDYTTRGYPDATKKPDGSVYTQTFNGNLFAVMCPAQTSWQTILTDVASQLTSRIGSKGIYIDQVAAAAPVEDMDPGHGHPLGGGHWWRDGYASMFTNIHRQIPAGHFITVEGGADYLADQVDGFLVEGWLTNNLVPAFQVVYGGRVQLFGKRTGTSRYHNQSFYCKLTQAFVQGIEPGRVSTYIVSDPNASTARPFVKRLAAMRHKLQDYLSFGTMLRPLEVSGSIPDITSSWTDYGTPVDVTIQALQTSLYKHPDGGSVAAIFANASMTDTISFSFDFDSAQHGLPGTFVTIQEVTETTSGTPQLISNHFTKNITLAPLESLAVIVKSYGIYLPLVRQNSP